MRNYPLQLDKYNISRWRYYELKAFCRQYDDMRLEADRVISLHGQDLSGMPKSTQASMTPVEAAVLRRDRYLRDIEVIEKAAEAAGGGGWKNALINSCCRGVAHADLDPADMPSSKREAFFAARREFFWILDASHK